MLCTACANARFTTIQCELLNIAQASDESKVPKLSQPDNPTFLSSQDFVRQLPQSLGKTVQSLAHSLFGQMGAVIRNQHGGIVAEDVAQTNGNNKASEKPNFHGHSPHSYRDLGPASGLSLHKQKPRKKRRQRPRH